MSHLYLARTAAAEAAEAWPCPPLPWSPPPPSPYHRLQAASTKHQALEEAMSASKEAAERLDQAHTKALADAAAQAPLAPDRSYPPQLPWAPGTGA